MHFFTGLEDYVAGLDQKIILEIRVLEAPIKNRQMKKKKKAEGNIVAACPTLRALGS